jgi:hypothetical protein
MICLIKPSEKSITFVDFKCDEEALETGFCIFHDRNYLQGSDDFSLHQQKITNRLIEKVNKSILVLYIL